MEPALRLDRRRAATPFLHLVLAIGESLTIAAWRAVRVGLQSSSASADSGESMGSSAVMSPLADTTNDWARALLDALDDAVFMHDCEGRILEVNEAACRRLGYTREEFLRLTT